MVCHAPAVDFDDETLRDLHGRLWERLSGLPSRGPGSRRALRKEADVSALGAVEAYTGGGYEAINEGLRTDGVDDECLRQAEGLQRVHKGFPSLEPGCEVWRAVSSADFLGGYSGLVGSVWHERGFLSTSASQEGAMRFLPLNGRGLLLRIRLAAPVPGLYIPWMPSPAWPREREVLLPRDCRLRFVHLSEPVGEEPMSYREALVTLLPPQ